MKPGAFIDLLRQNGITFFTGVPDSLLSPLSAHLATEAAADKHVIAANEGEALAIAAGAHLATGRMACVYMQNSGQGNAVNPLCSLCDPDVYGIPVLLVIGWRGQPGTHDEPQHVKQGRVTLTLNAALDVPTIVADPQASPLEQDRAIVELIRLGQRESRPVALVVPKGFFESGTSRRPQNGHLLVREAVIARILAHFADAAIVSTTGKISRELYELRARSGQSHERDFLTVGSMGHAGSLALGINLANPGLRVLCLDGDGAALMHMGSLAVNGVRAGGHFTHIVLNNEAHESVGGQPTVAGRIDLSRVASACGYHVLPPVREAARLDEGLQALAASPGPAFLEIFVSLASRKDLGRPRETPVENKALFMAFVQGVAHDGA
jgi:phosphonopyruvate decarboxylase